MTTARILRLHTAPDGHVWAGWDGVCAADSFLTAKEFVSTDLLAQASTVQLLGVPANAGLLVALHLARRGNEHFAPKHIRVGSPMVCYNGQTLQNPELVLQQLWHLPATARLPGRWHEYEEHDYYAYLLICTLQHYPAHSDEVRQVLRSHPAWRAISFVPTACQAAAARLLGEIVDPRWYGHEDRPNRVSRLYAYLGLTPRVIRGLYGSQILPRSDPAWRALLTIQAWGGDQPLRGAQALEDPRNFLWRIRRREQDWQGVLKASRAFVLLLRLVWLQQMTHREVFVPRFFFKTPAECTSYLLHVTDNTL